MNDIPRQKLKHIISQYDRAVCEDAKLCEGLLRDLCGQYRKEINVIVSAIKEGVVAELLNSNNNISSDAILSRLTKRLTDRWGMSSDVAIWAVDSWALALGVISHPRSVQPIVANPQPNLAPPSSNGQQSSIQPDPKIASASLPDFPPKFVYIWTAITSITVLGFGVAYHHKSQDFNTQVAEVELRDIRISVLENTNKLQARTIEIMSKNQPSVNTYIKFCNSSSAENVNVAFYYQEASSQKC
jgi:hypothetical protein